MKNSQPATLTCNCSGKPETYPNTTKARFEHNQTDAHHLAVLRETGAPEPLVQKLMAERAEIRETIAAGGLEPWEEVCL